LFSNIFYKCPVKNSLHFTLYYQADGLHKAR
jgi:hypothetical protein